MISPKEVIQISNIAGTDLKKWTHTFDEDGGPSPFAALHNLGTKDVLVSIRNKDGSASTGSVKSIAQDANLTLIHNKDGVHFYEGQTIIIIG